MKNRKDLVSLDVLSTKEIEDIIKLSLKLKHDKKAGSKLKGKTLGLVFEKPSNRTRVSFWAGMVQLGGDCIYLSPAEIQLGKREAVKDVAKVLSRYLDAIAARTYSHDALLELAEYASIPVINALTDLLHPCQALGDLLTVYEKKKKFKGIKLTYVGDGNNVLHSLLYAASKVGLDIAYATPKGYEPDKEVLKKARGFAKAAGSKVESFIEPDEAVKNADFIYTDVWASMHQEKELAKRKKVFKKYQINSSLLKKAKKGTLVMHCLPAKRGLEITDEIMDSKQSIVYDEAENRLHVEKAILYKLIRANKK
jgi:ornithine carbamoyltransferase